MPAQASQAGYTNPPVYTGHAHCDQRPISHQHGSQSGYSQSHDDRRRSTKTFDMTQKHSGCSRRISGNQS